MKTIKVSAKRLVKLGACGEQVRLFRKLYPRGLVIPAGMRERFRVLTLAAMRGLQVHWYVERCRLDAELTNIRGTFMRFSRGKLHSEAGPAMVECDGTLHYNRHGNRTHRVLPGYVDLNTGALVEPAPRIR